MSVTFQLILIRSNHNISLSWLELLRIKQSLQADFYHCFTDIASTLLKIDIVVGLQKRPFLGACEAMAILADLDL